MKKYLFIIMISFLPVFLWGQIKEYQYYKVKKMELGSENSQIGWNGQWHSGGWPGPAGFTIDNNLKFHITDYINERIQVFNKNIVFLYNLTDVY